MTLTKTRSGRCSSTPRVFRAYDANGRIIDGRLAQRDDERVAIVHARALGFGCYTFAVARA